MFAALARFAVDYSYQYTTGGGHSSVSNGFWGTYLGVSAVLGVVSIVAMWKIFTKAGRPGWAAIIPIYNLWVLAEIGGRPGWIALLILVAFVPFVGWLAAIAVSVYIALGVAERFGKSQLFAIVGLVIFSIVGYLILAFGDATYNGAPKAVAEPAYPPTKTPPVQ